MAIRPNKSNNYGRGWWFTFADGTRFGCLGLSAWEIKQEEYRHGKLVEKAPA